MQFRSASFQYAIVKLLFRASCPSSLPAPREGAAAAGAPGPGGPSGGTRRLQPTPIGPRRVPAEPPRRPLGRPTGPIDEASSAGREGAFSPLCSWGRAALGGHRGSPVPGVPPPPLQCCGHLCPPSAAASGERVDAPARDTARLPKYRDRDNVLSHPSSPGATSACSHPACPCPGYSCLFLPAPALPYPSLPLLCIILPCLFLPCRALFCLSLPCPCSACPCLACSCPGCSNLHLPCLSLPVPAPSATVSSPACKGPVQFLASALVLGGLGTAVGGFGGRVGAVWDG